MILKQNLVWWSAPASTCVSLNTGTVAFITLYDITCSCRFLSRRGKAVSWSTFDRDAFRSLKSFSGLIQLAEWYLPDDQ